MVPAQPGKTGRHAQAVQQGGRHRRGQGRAQTDGLVPVVGQPARGEQLQRQAEAAGWQLFSLRDGLLLATASRQREGQEQLDKDASNVVIDIVGTNGAVIDSVQLGALKAGQHAFGWDATGVDTSTVKGFAIRATDSSGAVTATPKSLVPVSAVSFQDGAMKLQLANGQRLAYDQVDAFM